MIGQGPEEVYYHCGTEEQRQEHINKNKQRDTVVNQSPNRHKKSEWAKRKSVRIESMILYQPVLFLLIQPTSFAPYLSSQSSTPSSFLEWSNNRGWCQTKCHYGLWWYQWNTRRRRSSNIFPGPRPAVWVEQESLSFFYSEYCDLGKAELRMERPVAGMRLFGAPLLVCCHTCNA